MAKLSQGARDKLPAKAFAGPKRSFPVQDRAHAKAAIMLAPQAEKSGSITPSQKNTIVTKARKKLGSAKDMGI
jgi:hypothetical protein